MTGEESIFSAVITPQESGWRLDRALASVVPTLSRERLKTLIAGGEVRDSAGLVRDPRRAVTPGEVFRISVPAPRPAHNLAEPIALEIVDEDEHLLVVNKPAGMVVHPAAGNPDGTLVNALLHHCAGRLSGIGGVARPGIVHRIDKDTSGLLVVAKTDRAHEHLSAQFARHSIERRYAAIVSGAPALLEGTIDAPLARSPHDRKKIAIQPRGRRAVTHYRRLTLLDHAALLECRLETGRTHQVRVHMASIGHALIGDPVYGRTAKAHRALLEDLNFRRQALHAEHLGFLHPIHGTLCRYQRPMPADMQDLFTRLRV